MSHASAARLDTVPKLLLRNAEQFRARPALRHKDLGIWQTRTWEAVREEVRAFAVGLRKLGLERGDAVAALKLLPPEERDQPSQFPNDDIQLRGEILCAAGRRAEEARAACRSESRRSPRAGRG